MGRSSHSGSLTVSHLEAWMRMPRVAKAHAVLDTVGDRRLSRKNMRLGSGGEKTTLLFGDLSSTKKSLKTVQNPTKKPFMSNHRL